MDRRMNSLIEAYQGIFVGTRIATVAFAMETAGLGCPICWAWTSWSGLSAGWSRFPGRPLAACDRGIQSARGNVEGRDLDHGQSVNFRPNPTLRGGHSYCGPRHRGFVPGPPRPHLLLFLMDDAQSKSKRSGRGFQDMARLAILGPNRTERHRASRRDRPGQKPAPTKYRSRKEIDERLSQLLQG